MTTRNSRKQDSDTTKNGERGAFAPSFRAREDSKTAPRAAAIRYTRLDLMNLILKTVRIDLMKHAIGI